MFVIKVGGSAGIDYNAFVDDLSQHRNFVLVHGGSHQLNELSTRLGRPPKFVTSVSGQVSRYTDRETLDLFTMIYAGKMNTMLVEMLQRRGINAVGLTGLDGRLAEGRQKEAIKIVEDGKKKILRGDLTGTIERINAPLLRLLLENGYTPVLTPPAISFDGVAINVDGDRFAAQVALALNVKTLIILSNVPGLLRDLSDSTSLIKKISRDEVESYMNQFAQGRMKKKLMGANDALRGGVQRVILGGATGPSPVTRALQGEGTVIE